MFPIRVDGEDIFVDMDEVRSLGVGVDGEKER